MSTTSESKFNAPVALHIPAILQNPTNRSIRQVEAHNAQQREKAQARREARAAGAERPTGNGLGDKRGKRVLRRVDNAAFLSNPHIVLPNKSDYAPPIPLQHRPLGPSFPQGAIPRSEASPSVELPERDPTSSNSLNGAFSTSLKGTRALLRKRGRRAEILVGLVEKEVRGWLAGNYDHSIKSNTLEWKIVDETLVDKQDAESTMTPHASTSASRRMPEQHRITTALPVLPLSKEGGGVANQNQLPAILEISRSPAHLSWYIPDSFERLVVHLICRYYELITWSESHLTIANEPVRLTHIILPNIVRPSIPNISGQSLTLLTPETSEISGQSSSDIDTLASDTPSETDTDTDNDSESDTRTERGDSDVEEGYSLEGDTTITLPEGIEALSLERVSSHTSSHSGYASSEGGSGSDWDSTLGDSLILPPAPAPLSVPGIVGSQSQMIPSIPSASANTGGWIDFDSGSEIGSEFDQPLPSAINGNGNGNGSLKTANSLKAEIKSMAQRNISTSTSAVGLGRGWEDRPTFFEYLYGA